MSAINNNQTLQALYDEINALKKKNTTLKAQGTKAIDAAWRLVEEVKEQNAFLIDEVKRTEEWAEALDYDLACANDDIGVNEVEIEALKKKNDKIETDYLHACLYAQEDEKKIADLYEQCYQDDEIITQLQDTLGEACEDLVSLGAIRSPQGRSYSL